MERVASRCLPPTHKTTPTELGLEFRGGAAELFEREDAEILLDGPAGTGKTLAALWRMHLYAHNHPGFRGLFLRKTNADLRGSALQTWRDGVLARADFGAKWYGGSAGHPAGYRYPNGSFIAVGGLVPDPTKIMSREYDAVFINEASQLLLDEYEAVLSRLRGSALGYSQVIADVNPQGPTHWINQRANSETMRRILSRHEDNPRWFDASGAITRAGRQYIEGKLDKLTGVRYQRLRLGKWVAAEGQIYETWDSALHVVEPFAISEFWPRYWSIDFGYTNPFVWQWWAEDPDGRLYLYREIYMSERLVEDHALQGRAFASVEPRPRFAVADHDAEGRATFEKYTGVDTEPAYKSVQDGIQAVQARLRPAGDGKPRLFVFRNATIEIDAQRKDARLPTSTEDEFPEYVWNPMTKTTKEVPLKENDHGMDATRYLVAAVDKIGEDDALVSVSSYLGGRP